MWSQMREGARWASKPRPTHPPSEPGFLTRSLLRHEIGLSGLAPSILSFHYGPKEGEVYA